jgi:hypothetical protein
MITTSHKPFGDKPYFYFSLATIKLNTCFLKQISSAAGKLALNKIIEVQENNGLYPILMKKNESKLLSEDEISILKSIPNFYVKSKNSVKYYKFALSRDYYDNLFQFLEFAQLVKPYICRAVFTSSLVYGIAVKKAVNVSKKKKTKK